MNWQAYIYQLLNTQKVKNVVICGHAGKWWVCSSGFPVTAEELKKIVDNYENVEVMASMDSTLDWTGTCFCQEIKIKGLYGASADLLGYIASKRNKRTLFVFMTNLSDMKKQQQ